MVEGIETAERFDANMSHGSIDNGWEGFLERLRRLWAFIGRESGIS